MLTCQRDREHTALRGLFTEYTVLWALSNATREERQLEPVPGKPKNHSRNEKGFWLSSKPMLEVPVQVSDVAGS